MGKLWQRNYYEHIIRDEQSFFRIADYIIKNPANWNEDRFYNNEWDMMFGMGRGLPAQV